MPGPKKNSYKEFDNEKRFPPLENAPPSPPPPPPLPDNFSKGPSLSHHLASNDVKN